MRDAWEGICNAYLKEFCDKHLLDLSEAYWGHDDPGTIACIEGNFISMDVIRYDIDHDVPPEMFWDWYEYDLDICEIEADYRYYNDLRKFTHINYPSFCKGVPLPYSSEEIALLRKELSDIEGPADNSDKYIAVMSELTGLDIMENSRRVSVAWPRYMVMFQMRKDGLTFKRIGDRFGKDHTTVMYAVKVMKDMLDMPKMYPDEIKLWQQFQKIIKDE